MALEEDLADIPTEKFKLIFLERLIIEDKKVDSQFRAKWFENI